MSEKLKTVTNNILLLTKCKNIVILVTLKISCFV